MTELKRPKNPKPRLFQILAISLGLISSLIIGLGTLRYYNKQTTPSFLGSYTVDGFTPHNYLGYAPKENSKLHSCKIINTDTIYCVQYTLNANAKRVVPINDSASKHVLFFGCSFTYGEGVNDEETFTYRLGKLRADLQIYNYAYSGYGPQQMLATLQFENLNKYVNDQEGYLVYMLMPEHIYRASGEPYYIQGWGSSSPHYAFHGDSLKYYKSHMAWRPIYTSWHRFLGWSGLGNALSMFPKGYKQSDINLTVAICEKAKEQYLSQFPGGRFIVSMFPMEQPEFEVAHIISTLKNAGIEVWDLNNVIDVTAEFTIANDGHPSNMAHLELAKYFSVVIE